MGKLIDRNRRKQAKGDRSTRQEAILEGARKALLCQPPGELTLEALDRVAGLRQGSTSMYFGSLESLIIRLLREETSSWLDRLESVVQECPAPLSSTDLAQMLATALQERPLFCRLLGVMPAMADRRTVEMDQLLDLETTRLRRFKETGAVLESLCPDLEAGGGLVILRRAVLLAAALEPLVNPPSGLLLAMNDQSLSPLYPDAGDEFTTVLKAILAAVPHTS